MSLDLPKSSEIEIPEKWSYCAVRYKQDHSFHPEEIQALQKNWGFYLIVKPPDTIIFNNRKNGNVDALKAWLAFQIRTDNAIDFAFDELPPENIDDIEILLE